MKVWIRVDFIDSEGHRHIQGMQEDLPDDEVRSLLVYGIVSTEKPAGVLT